jgi:hypothetical protein
MDLMDKVNGRKGRFYHQIRSDFSFLEGGIGSFDHHAGGKGGFWP